MRLKLTNLGRIASADIDIRPLTVFIGENGTNKTWAVYALHGIVRTLSRAALGAKRFRFVGWGNPANMSLAESLWQAAQDVGEADASAKFQHEYEGPMGGALELDSLATVLGLPPSKLNPRVVVNLHANPESFPGSMRGFSITLRNKGALAVITARLTDGRAVERRVVNLANAEALLNAAEQFSSTMIDRCTVLPAERKGLSILRVAPQSQTTSLAIADYLEMLDDARTTSGESVYGRTLSHLQEIIGGRVSYSGSDSEGARQAFVTRDGQELPLHAAHSLVRSVAGLSAYLERLAKPGDVVIIDELEMNAHPRAQLMLTEFICVLVNAGLRVVFTTHSPYIVDHLSNLMGAAMAPKSKQKKLAEKFLLKTTDAFISAEKVAAHWFKEDEKDPKAVVVEEILDRERGLIRWKTFADQSDWVANIYSDVLEARGPRSAKDKASAKRKGADA